MTPIGLLVHPRLPSSRIPWFTSINFCSKPERDTVRTKCLAYKHSTMTWPGLQSSPSIFHLHLLLLSRVQWGTHPTMPWPPHLFIPAQHFLLTLGRSSAFWTMSVSSLSKISRNSLNGGSNVNFPLSIFSWTIIIWSKRKTEFYSLSSGLLNYTFYKTDHEKFS